MAVSLSQLEQSLKNPTYVPKTEEELLAQAQNRYKAQYDANRLAAQQAAETSDLALQQQRASLAPSYARQLEEARKNTARTLSSNDRYSLQRGMQRSSYNAQRLANIMLEGDQTLADIAQAQTTAESNIDAQRAQLAAQLAQQLAQYNAAEQSDIQGALADLRDQEYERQQAADQYANDLLMALYEYGQKAGSSGSGSGSGSSSSGSKKSSSADTKPTSDSSKDTKNSFTSSLTAALDAANATKSTATSGILDSVKKSVTGATSAAKSGASTTKSGTSGLTSSAFNSVVSDVRKKLTATKK